MQEHRRHTRTRRIVWYGVLLLLLLWAIWSGFFTLDSRLAAIKDDMAFLLRREGITPEELQWVLTQIENENLDVVETFLAERIALIQNQSQTSQRPLP